VQRNVAVTRKEIPKAIRDEVERLNGTLDGSGRILVRPSGTEPVVRVLAEAEAREEAERLCATIAALVSQELG
jgi:phosphoglucosamine mutase